MPNADLSAPTMETLHRNVLAWLVANEIDPFRIVANPTMTLDGDRLTTDQKVQVDGRDQIDPATGDTVARETATYTITVPPPPDVAEWLRPRCSECGR